MNYQTIKLKGGAEVQVDMDAKRTACKKCGELIRFGITKNSKYIPIIEMEDGEYQAHFADCKFAGDFRGKGTINNRIEEQNRNQEFLNSL